MISKIITARKTTFEVDSHYQGYGKVKEIIRIYRTGVAVYIVSFVNCSCTLEITDVVETEKA